MVVLQTTRLRLSEQLTLLQRPWSPASSTAQGWPPPRGRAVPQLEKPREESSAQATGTPGRVGGEREGGKRRHNQRRACRTPNSTRNCFPWARRPGCRRPLFTLCVHGHAQPNPVGDQGVLSDLGDHKVALLRGGQGEEVTPCQGRRREKEQKNKIRGQPLNNCWITADDDGV